MQTEQQTGIQTSSPHTHTSHVLHNSKVSSSPHVSNSFIPRLTHSPLSLWALFTDSCPRHWLHFLPMLRVSVSVCVWSSVPFRQPSRVKGGKFKFWSGVTGLDLELIHSWQMCLFLKPCVCVIQKHMRQRVIQNLDCGGEIRTIIFHKPRPEIDCCSVCCVQNWIKSFDL